MTDKQKHWMTDTSGAKALVEGAEERDRWAPRGWLETTEPAGDDLVWLEHDVHGGRQLFPAAAAPQWTGLGWNPAPPPEPVDLTKDPQFVDQAAPSTAEPAPLTPEPDAPKPASKSRAASGAEKE